MNELLPTLKTNTNTLSAPLREVSPEKPVTIKDFLNHIKSQLSPIPERNENPDINYVKMSAEVHIKPGNSLDCVISGFTKNYHGKGIPALLTHATEEGQLVYAQGMKVVDEIQKDPAKKILNKYDVENAMWPKDYIHRLNKERGIDLRSNGNTGKGPLYLIGCHTAKKGKESTAQAVADYTCREVYAYGNRQIISPSVDKLHKGGKEDYVRFHPAASSAEKLQVKSYNLIRNLSGSSRPLDKLPKKRFRPKGKISM